MSLLKTLLVCVCLLLATSSGNQGANVRPSVSEAQQQGALEVSLAGGSSEGAIEAQQYQADPQAKDDQEATTSDDEAYFGDDEGYFFDDHGYFDAEGYYLEDEGDSDLDEDSSTSSDVDLSYYFEDGDFDLDNDSSTSSDVDMSGTDKESEATTDTSSDLQTDTTSDDADCVYEEDNLPDAVAASPGDAAAEDQA